jgi:hypothetical protein
MTRTHDVAGGEAQAKRAEFLAYWQGIQSN